MSNAVSPPPVPEDRIVILHHGTSEGHLASLLQNGFQSQPQSPQDFLRSIIADHLPGQSIDDALIEQVRSKHSRIGWRSDESNSGTGLFTAGDAKVAAKYATLNTAHGGELGQDVHTALRQSGFPDLPPRFAGARPVLLTLEVPAADLHLEKGLKLHTEPDGKTVAHTPHEVFVNDTRRLRIAGVTFARAQANGWSFDGQPALTPQQAQAEISPAFAAIQSKFMTAQDKDAQHIAETIYLFRQDPDVTIEHVRHKPVAAVMLYDAEGTLEKRRIPDPDFEPATASFSDAQGFKGLSQTYKLPGSITPQELDAYLNVLSAREQHGTLSTNDKEKAHKNLFTRLCADNPSLATAGIDQKNPAHVTAALHGVTNGLTVRDIAFSTQSPQNPAYQAFKKSAGFSFSWNPAPETIDSFRTQMDKKLAAFNTPAPPKVP